MMVRASIFFILLLLLSATPLVSTAHSAEDLRTTDPVIKYRRVFVPQAEIDQYTGPGYWPMAREEFATKVEQIRRRAMSSAANAVRLESADYSAVYVDGQLVNGSAILRVNHAADESAVLDLAPCRVAIGAAVWEESGMPANLGMDYRGKLVATIERSGNLQFPWTLRGQPNRWGEVVFDVEIPASPRNRWILDLPEDATLVVDRGIASVKVDEPEDGDVANRPPIGMKRWAIELGGTSQFRATVSPPSAIEKRRQTASLQQDTTYQLTNDGVEVICRFDLEVDQEPIENLWIRAHPDLQITQVRVDDRDHPWTLTGGADGGDQQLFLSFAEPFDADARSIELSAVGALRTQEPWTLPTFQVRDAFWCQGTMAIVVPASLELQKLTPRDARPLEVSSAADGSPATVRRFQMFDAGSQLEITVARRRRDVTVVQGTTVELEAGAMIPRIVADLECRFGERFVLEVEVPNAWTIEGIDSEPADALAGFQPGDSQAGKGKLQIRLDRALTPERPIRLTFQARRARSFSLRPPHFRPVRFLDVRESSRQVSVAPSPGNRLDLIGDADLSRLDPNELTASDAELLQIRPGGIAFVDGEAADGLMIRVSREDPAFAASIFVEAELEKGALTETYRIVCTPESTPVDRLLVHLSERRGDEIEWTLADNENQILQARQLTAKQQQQKRLSSQGETWDIALPNPANTPFEIRAARTTPTDSAQAIALPTLPVAASQDGWLSIFSTDGGKLSIEAIAVKPIPSRPVPPDKFSPARAQFRFDPSRNARVTVEIDEHAAGQHPLWAWHCLLTSQFFPDGQTIHNATYFLESVGGSDFQFRLPVGYTLLGVTVDGQELARPARSGNTREYHVTLPGTARYPRLKISFVKRRPTLKTLDELIARFPEVDFPVLDRRWTLWVPPDWEAARQAPYLWPQSTPSVEWTHRLLGPLAASRDSTAFRLFSKDDWVSLRGQSGELRRSVATAQVFLQVLGASILDVSAGTQGPMTWQQLFSGYRQQAEAESRVPDAVWVDAALLADEGLGPKQTLPSVSGRTPLDVATAALVRANIVVVVNGDTLVLTSSRGLSRYPESIETTTNQVLAIVRPGSPLSIEMQSLGRWTLPGILPLEAWITEPAIPRSPWSAQSANVLAGPINRPWRVWEVNVAHGDTHRVTVKRPAALWAVGWTVFLASAGALIWIGRRWRTVVLISTVLCAVIAMLVPDVLVPIFSMLFLGNLLAGLVLIVARRPVAEPADEHRERASTEPVAASVVGAIFLVVVLLLASRSARAAEEPVPPAPVHQLIIPVDDELQPWGKYDYLPLEMWEEIIRRANEVGGSQRSWLVRRAVYRASFEWRSQRSALDLSSFTAVYQLELFQPDQRVEIPWNADDQEVEILEARLADQPVELNWNVQRTVFSVTVQPQGVSQLELVLRPSVRDDPGERTVRFPVPPIAQSRLRIQSPGDSSSVEVLSAMGAAQLDPESGERVVELGPAAEISLRWPFGLVAETAVQRIDTRQLMWLSIQPGDPTHPVVLDAKVTLQTSTGFIDEVGFFADRRLQLLPLGDDQLADVYPPTVETDDEQQIQIRLREPRESEFSLHLQFLMADTTGLGNIPLPNFDVTTGRVTRRCLAVSVSPDLEFSPDASAALAPMDAGEFLAVWGDAALAPNLCYRLLEDSATWSLATRARPPRTESRQELDISANHNAVRWVLRARLDTSGGSVFSHQLSVPRGFQVDSASVLVDGSDVALPARHDESGSITVFLRRGVSGPHQLELRGRQKLGSGRANLRLHDVSVSDANLRSCEVRMYRHADVSVEVESPVEIPGIEGLETGSYHDGLGRLVAAFDLAANDENRLAGVTLRIRPNRPVINARLVTTLERGDDNWEAIAELDARVDPNAAEDRRGVIDKFRFEIPAEWTEPFTLEPAMPYEVRPIPGQRRHLIMRPPQPVADRFIVRIRGALELGDRERGRTPNIIPLDVTSSERFFVLPTQLDQQRIDWETSGLQPVALRDVLSAGQPSAALTAFRVWSKPRAVIADVQHVAGEKQISLADVHVGCGADGQLHGFVTFGIEPAGANTCVLEIPPNCEMVSAMIEGVPATVTALADDRWSLRLSSERLPQQLTVVFQEKLDRPKSDEPATIRVPWIRDFIVVRTLWTIRGPPGDTLRSEQARDHQVSQVRQEVFRLYNTASLIETTSGNVLDSPPQEVRDWYAPWAVRLACSHARIARDRCLVKPSESPIDADTVREIENQQDVIAERLKTAPILEDVRTQTARFPQPQDVWSGSDCAGATIARFAFIGTTPSIEVQFEPSSELATGPNYWAATCLLAFGGFTVFLARRKIIENWLQQWPFALGVVVGWIWWLWATPSLLGWVIILVSLWGALRLPLPSRRVRKNDRS